MNFPLLLFGIAPDEVLTCATCLKTMANLLTSLLYLSIRVQWVEKSKKPISSTDHIFNSSIVMYEVKKFKRGLLVCKIILPTGCFLSTMYLLYESIILLTRNSEDAYVAYCLSILSDFSEFIITILIWKLLWVKPRVFVNLLNALGHIETEQTTNWKFKVCILKI